MKLCIPFRVARVGMACDSAGNKSATVLLVPKASDHPHDITAALWGTRYSPNGELNLNNIDPGMVGDMEPGASVNVIIEIL